MQAMAKVTSKGQITIPKAVRDELGLETGGWVVFRIDRGGHAAMEPVPSFLDLAGSVRVPPDKRGLSWREIQKQTRLARAEAFRKKKAREER